jgi:hypothetical protein
MRINLDLWTPTTFTGGSLVLDFDPEQLNLIAVADTARFILQATIERIPRPGVDPALAHVYPVLMDLHGTLYCGPNYSGVGAALEAPTGLPIAFPGLHQPQGCPLAFTCSQHYLQYMEDLRAAQPAPKVTMGMSFWGTAVIVGDKDWPSEMTTPTTAALSLHRRIEMLHVVRIQGASDSSFPVSRSHWGDMLEASGYPHNRVFQLPRGAGNAAPELKIASQHLVKAWEFFAHDEYRQAVHMCRQARDALLTGNKPTWANRVLAPVLGQEKADMVDESIAALNHLGNPASHGESTIQIDRETAEYVIAQLSLILSYIDRKLK